MSPHFVYRCYDADDRLLYIGCTTDVNNRINQHRSPCFHRDVASRHLAIRMTRWTTSEPYLSKEAGRAAEAEAISAEAPLLNVLHNQGRHDHTWPERKAGPRHDLAEVLAAFNRPDG